METIFNVLYFLRVICSDRPFSHCFGACVHRSRGALVLYTDGANGFKVIDTFYVISDN